MKLALAAIFSAIIATPASAQVTTNYPFFHQESRPMKSGWCSPGDYRTLTQSHHREAARASAAKNRHLEQYYVRHAVGAERYADLMAGKGQVRCP